MQPRSNPGAVIFLALIAGLIGGLVGAFVYGTYLVAPPPDDGGVAAPTPRTNTVQIKTETDAIVEDVPYEVVIRESTPPKA